MSHKDLGAKMPGKVPTYDRLMNPLLRALKALGGSGSIEEIYDKAVDLEQLPEDVITLPHDPEKSNQTQAGGDYCSAG